MEKELVEISLGGEPGEAVDGVAGNIVIKHRSHVALCGVDDGVLQRLNLDDIRPRAGGKHRIDRHLNHQRGADEVRKILVLGNGVEHKRATVGDSGKERLEVEDFVAGHVGRCRGVDRFSGEIREDEFGVALNADVYRHGTGGRIPFVWRGQSRSQK